MTMQSPSVAPPGGQEGQNQLLQRLLDAVERLPRVPQGLVNAPEIAVSGNAPKEYIMQDEPDAHGRPWFSVTIYSDTGGSYKDVYVRFNNKAGPFFRLSPGDTLSVDLKKPWFTRLYYYCTKSTDTANLRIIGEA